MDQSQFRAGVVRTFLMGLIATGLAVAVLPASADDEPAVVTTDKGPVRGITTSTLQAFLGIPYAAAPTDDLRWKPPQPHARWRRTLDATQFGDACAQLPSSAGQPSVSEDCLYLNVYVPQKGRRDEARRQGDRRRNGRTRQPVMVWIHGGSLTSGAGGLYDPTQLAERGEVIVVTLNYRLGILGFLSHPGLTAESRAGSSGNYGLMDQQLALRWVQRNIGEFGGDPDNVTVFGGSAGALSIHAHLASPRAAGLFHKAIVQSGAYSLTQATLATAEGRGAVFAGLAGCSNQTAACLRQLPVAAILALQRNLLPAGVLPSVDGTVLPQSIGTALASGRFNRVPVIEGSNHDEFRAFVGAAESLAGVPLTAAGYIPFISTTLGVPIETATFLGTAVYPLAAYPPPATAPSIALGALGTDALFACNARVASRWLATHVPTWQYEFNDPTAPLPLGLSLSYPSGAYHASELQYLFAPTPLGFPGLNVDQRDLSEAMIRYWTRFAHTGNPNGSALPAWPRYRASDRFQSLELTGPVTKGGFAADHKCAAWGTP